MSREFYQGLGKTVEWPNFQNALSLTFDDVLITTRNSEVESRSQVDLSGSIGPYHIRKLVTNAPMDTVSSDAMVRALAHEGAIGTLHREETNRFQLCEEYTSEGIPCIYAVGQRHGLEEAKMFKERGAEIILIDAANGGTKDMKELASDIKKKLDVTVIAGNITTYEQAEDYKKYGIDIARVGVGGGGVCTTRLKTGVGMPQLSAIFETTSTGIYVIADGGIKAPGDVAKAFAAGAQMVMIGSMFGGTDEAPGEVLEIDGKKKKALRGQASKDYMTERGIDLTEHRTDEGIGTAVKLQGSVKHILNDISGGVSSAMSYVGAHNLAEFRDRAQFVIVSNATMRENQPHVIFDRE